MLLAFLSGTALIFGQARNSAPEPTFSELTHEDSKRLDQQRVVVAAAVKQRYGTESLSRTKNDLPILQRLIDDKVYKKSHT